MTPLAARVATRFRLARRYLTAEQLGIGDTLQTETLRVHRFRDILRVTDLTNAGKRGKSVDEFSVSPGYGWGARESDRNGWLDQTAAAFVRLAPRGYGALLAYIQGVEKEHPGWLEFSERKQRGVDVEPHGEVFDFKIPQPNKGYLDVRSSPLDFRVTDHHFMESPGEGSRGLPVRGFFQDTSYWPAKKKDAAVFYAWMKESHQRARRFMNMDMFRQTWASLGVSYDSH